MKAHTWEARPEQQYFGPACWQTSLMAFLARVLLHPVLTILTFIGMIVNFLWPSALQRSRLDGIDWFFKCFPPRRYTTIEKIDLAHCRAEWVLAPNSLDSSRVIIYFHGSALVTLGLNSYRRFCSHLSAVTGARVLSVGYRLAPRATLQDMMDDGINAYQRVLDLGYLPRNIILAGDSAGGLLVTTTATVVRDQGLTAPAGSVLLSPLVSEDMLLKQRASCAQRDPCFPYRMFSFIYTVFVTVNGTRSLPVMPSELDLHGLGPCLIQVSNTEMLRYDALMLTERLVEAGVPTWLQIWDQALHVFQVTCDINPDAARAIHEIACFTHYVFSRSAMATGAVDG